jgi:hypothetical protein
VNEYTRRAETSWTLASAITLVTSVGASLALLLTAKGPLVTDPSAVANAAKAAEVARSVAACEGPSKRLADELGVLKNIADAAALEDEAEPEPAPKRGASKPKPKPKPALELAWPGVKPTHELARTLQACREPVAALVQPPAEGERAWDRIVEIAALEPPTQAAAQVETAKRVVALARELPATLVAEQIAQASALAASRAGELERVASTAKVQSPLPKGLFGREAAVAAGVIFSLVALLISFFSLRATSVRRMNALLGLRARPGEPPPSPGAPSRAGLQAATILRLSGESNGGEPGLVLGAASGGLLAAALLRLDADFYVAGVLGGLVVGLLLQLVYRRLARTGDFRARALALAEIEKPTVSIVLVLGTIQHGLEEDFLEFFMALAPVEAAHTVERLAHQAEERILAAADAQAAQAPR